MKKFYLLVFLSIFSCTLYAEEKSHYVETPYSEPKVMYEFYFDHPDKIASALFWIRSLINPLMESPYDMAPEFMDIVVVVHGTEIVTLAKKNYERYKTVVERMRYYADLGVKFKVCALAAHDFGYEINDFQPFVDVVPSAMAEMVHWQQQGYASIRPVIMEKLLSTEELINQNQ